MTEQDINKKYKKNDARYLTQLVSECAKNNTRTSVATYSKPFPLPKCRVLPLGKFNGMILHQPLPN